MAYYPSFLQTIRALDKVLGDLAGPEWTLEDALLEDASSSHVNEAKFSQPLCTAVQVALVNLLESWGIKTAIRPLCPPVRFEANPVVIILL